MLRNKVVVVMKNKKEIKLKRWKMYKVSIERISGFRVEAMRYFCGFMNKYIVGVYENNKDYFNVCFKINIELFCF